MSAGAITRKCLDFQPIGFRRMSGANRNFLVHCLLPKKASSGGEGKSEWKGGEPV
jgi:hypothetical protein